MRKSHKYKIAKLRKIWLFLIMFIVWLIINTIINEVLPIVGGVRGGNEYLEISAFQIIKFIELFLLLIYIYFNLVNKKVLITSLFAISLAGFLQSLIAIYQFIFQRSLFNLPILAKITGETTICPQIPGIAKIVVDGEKMIRAYGTFPHSNVLGGFLIFSIIISIYLLLEHEYTLLSRYRLNYVQFYNTKLKKSQVQIIISLLWIVVIFTQITALLFTFSRSAWTGFVISMMVLLFLFRLFHVKQSRIVSRETLSNNQNLRIFCHSNRSERGASPVLNSAEKYAKNEQSKIKNGTSERSGEICKHNLLSFVNYFKIKVYSLTDPSTPIVARDDKLNTIKNSAEKMDYISKIVSRETFLNFKEKLNYYLLAIFISFLFIGLFDHYFWTLQQGRLIFWLVLGMLLIDVRFKVKDD